MNEGQPHKLQRQMKRNQTIQMQKPLQSVPISFLMIFQQLSPTDAEFEQMELSQKEEGFEESEPSGYIPNNNGRKRVAEGDKYEFDDE